MSDTFHEMKLEEEKDREEEQQTATEYPKIGKEIGDLVEEKQIKYGDSFGRCHKIMEILYPDGLGLPAYTEALAVVRVVDKLFRIANRNNTKELGLHEDESPWRDIAGYALLMIEKEEQDVSDKR